MSRDFKRLKEKINPSSVALFNMILLTKNHTNNAKDAKMIIGTLGILDYLEIANTLFTHKYK